MPSKQELKDLVQKLLELVQRLVGSTCFTQDELSEVISKLRKAVDELEKVIS
jgi:hypothetical protein